MFRAARSGVLVVMLAMVVASCGASVPSATPRPTPRPTPTPDPHLVDPASVDVLIARLATAGLAVRANNASRGPGGEPVKKVNATLANWPLLISEYSSTARLQELRTADAGTAPGSAQAPLVVIGLNIVVEFGPPLRQGGTPADPAFATTASALVEALEPLLGPLEQVLPPSPSPSSSPSPTASAAP